MVKHTQTMRRQKPTNCLSVFDHFVKLALKGLQKIGDLKVKERFFRVKLMKSLKSLVTASWKYVIS